MSVLMAEARLLLTDERGVDADESEFQDAILNLDFRLMVPTIVTLLIAKLRSSRYLNRSHIPRNSATIHLLLSSYKYQRPEIFRNKLRVYPETFDELVTLLTEAPIFASMTVHNAKSF
ncbi:hypothetical protein V1523DRAFT_33275 [Lipomyces doorenjongii]